MTDPARVTPLYPKLQSAESRSELRETVQECLYHGAHSWFVRYQADGSWSVEAAGQAANDPVIMNDE